MEYPKPNKDFIYDTFNTFTRRYRDHDSQLSDRMLEFFALLSSVEKQIDRMGRTSKRTVDLRQRLSRPIWEQIRNLSQSVLDAEKLKSIAQRAHQLWPKKSPIYKACYYIVRHYPELTEHLTDGRLDPTNNRAERLLRSEKILLVSSKFRKSEIGRVSLDILRSLIMTARAAEVSPRAYLSWALAQPEQDIEKNPHLYTPLAYRTQHLAASSSQATGS